MLTLLLKARKSYPVGTRRKWRGQDYIKTNKGWMKAGKDKKKQIDVNEINKKEKVQLPVKQPIKSKKDTARQDLIQEKTSNLKQKGIDKKDINKIQSHPDLTDKEKLSQLQRLQKQKTRKENQKNKEKSFDTKIKNKVNSAKKEVENKILRQMDNVINKMNPAKSLAEKYKGIPKSKHKRAKDIAKEFDLTPEQIVDLYKMPLSKIRKNQEIVEQQNAILYKKAMKEAGGDPKKLTSKYDKVFERLDKRFYLYMMIVDLKEF